MILEGKSDWPISVYSCPIEGESGRKDFMGYLYDWRGVQDALKSSAVRGSMDAMERAVTAAPQLSRQGAVKQPILIEGAYNGSC